MIRRLLPTLALLLAAATFADACSIPVFRYALDRWEADRFQLEVSPDDARDAAVAHFLRNLTDTTPLNLEVVHRPTPGPSRLLFPHPPPGARPAWTGPLAAVLPQFDTSPARREIARRLLSGESGVWVLVESGQPTADDAAAHALEKRLRYLETVAQLPRIDPADPTSKLGPGPALRVQFSLLRLRHDDPAEALFLAALAGPKTPPTAPWLSLVFGRARALGAWPAADFGDEQIDEACLFLLGACSCEVKRLNPGWDLLIHQDWREALQTIGFPAASPEPLPAAPETVTIAPAQPVTPAPRLVAPPSTATLALAAAGLLALGGLAWWLLRGRK